MPPTLSHVLQLYYRAVTGKSYMDFLHMETKGTIPPQQANQIMP